MVEFPSPPCGAFTGAEAAHLRPIKYRLDPAAHPTGRPWLHAPDRLDGFGDERHVDVLDGERTKNRRDIFCKCVAPLLAVLRILPAYFVCADIGIRALIERHRTSGTSFCSVARFASSSC